MRDARGSLASRNGRMCASGPRDPSATLSSTSDAPGHPGKTGWSVAAFKIINITIIAAADCRPQAENLVGNVDKLELSSGAKLAEPNVHQHGRVLLVPRLCSSS